MSFMKSKFLVVEGIDGSGTTTITKMLVEYIRGKGYDVVETMEPTTENVGKLIRDYFDGSERNISSGAEAYLFSADRYDHVNKVIIPSLQHDKWVVSCRYLYSTYAYQGTAGNISLIRRLNEGFPKPEICILLDNEPSESLNRLQERESATIVENVDTLVGVHARYRNLVNTTGFHEVVLINSGQPIEKVFEDVLSALRERNIIA